MLDPARVAAVKRLHDRSGLSMRAIARETGVSRGTVAKICSGKYPDYQKLRQARQLRDMLAAFEGPIRRCKCGRLAQFPKGSDQCAACDLELLAKTCRRKGPEADASGSPFVALDLKPADRARYEEVRRAKVAEENRRLSEEPPWPEENFVQVDDVDGDEVTQEGKILYPEEIAEIDDE